MKSDLHQSSWLDSPSRGVRSGEGEGAVGGRARLVWFSVMDHMIQIP